MCRIKKINNFSSYEEYEKNVADNYKKYKNAITGTEVFDTYEDYEQSVAIASNKEYELSKLARKVNDIHNYSEYITDEYKSSIDKKIDYYSINFNSEEEKKYIYSYMAHIDEFPETTNLSFNDKIKCSKYLMKYDKENGYRILLSTPTMKSGTIDVDLEDTEVQYQGKYLEYYNPDGINVTAPLIEYKKDENGNIKEYAIEAEKLDNYIWECSNYYNSIMQKTYNEYTEKFRNQIIKNVQKITLINATYSHDWAAFCTETDNTNSNITIDMDAVNEDSSFMLSAYTHELGHAYANASSDKKISLLNYYLNKTDIDVTDEWGKIYEQINRNDPNHNFLRDYAHKNQIECFAECVTEYYANPSDDVDFNPNDLKTIDIEVGGKEMTLYDYMDELLN